ncbi:MAG: phosphorylase [Bdellovibrionales bacterium]|nr:phosphorylase [Bdellovibrionales bacterium]
MRKKFHRSATDVIVNESEEPIRAEIFNTSRLESHAESLARAQNLTDHPHNGVDLYRRIKENRQILEMAYRHILRAIDERRAITPAAEWLVDNFHLLRAQLKDIHEHFPPRYYRELPKIAAGALAGHPRVYGVAWAFVAHTDSHFDPEVLRVFISAYQRVQPLTIGELWAVPISLRLVLIENFRRLAVRIIESQNGRQEADLIADSLLGVGETQKISSEQAIDLLTSRPIARSFAVQLLHRLRLQEAHVGHFLRFIEQRLAAQNQSLEDWVTIEHNSQSAANATARNIVTSTRQISSMDWPEFFEQVSLVDNILCEGSEFPSLDFVTRDRYRHRIEVLAQGSTSSEIEIARAIVSDPGSHLIGPGRHEFEKSIGFRPSISERFSSVYSKYGTLLYLGSIFILTMLLSYLTADYAFAEFRNEFQTLVIAFLSMVLSSEIAIALVNRGTVALVGPKYLPRMNFENGLPENCRTMIVVPTVFTDKEEIRGQLEQIEVHYLSNRDKNIYLALLTDGRDAQSEVTEDDEQILATAHREIRALNERYPVKTGQHPRFSIYHRRRMWNPQEGCWMGWERKRGKIYEFNRLLRGAKDTTYGAFFGAELLVPDEVRYVITLDADTKIPRGCARKLVGVMAHPLNHPHFDKAKGRVVAGYGILQPRITPLLADSHESSIFRELSSSASGIDPYTSAVSDVYQDLFQEGSYSGKGIYDLAAFEQATRDKIPENSVLSHDLLEGNFARCGFLSDIEFFEDFPSHTNVAALRTHRWIRGDWQLLPWIFGFPSHRISLIGRWKMIDNLRRSLVAPANFLFFVLATSFAGWRGWPLFLLFATSLLTPTLISLWTDSFSRQRDQSLLLHFLTVYKKFEINLRRTFLFFTLLPYHAWISVDAIGRTFYRLVVSGKKRLEWTTAAQAKASANLDLRSFVLSMRGAILLSFSGFIFLFSIGNPVSLATPTLLLWLTSPWWARFFSIKNRNHVNNFIKPDDAAYLRSTARRIWLFFTTFVTAESNDLPPDNFQEDPHPIVFHRSSPTNFGLYLLSILAAKDFGWIGTLETIDRLESTLKSLLLLPRHKGHFYNWYDIKNLKALEPRYISSVDNGNLTGHLFAIAQGCVEILRSPPQPPVINSGILGTALILENALNRLGTNRTQSDENFRHVKEAFVVLRSLLQTETEQIKNWSQHWTNLQSQSVAFTQQCMTIFPMTKPTGSYEILNWCQALQNDIESSARDYLSLSQWRDFANEGQLNTKLSMDHTWWSSFRQRLNRRVPLEETATHCSQILDELMAFRASEVHPQQGHSDLFEALIKCLKKTSENSRLLVQRTKEIHAISRQLIQEMDFRLLYDSKRKLFSIGLRVAEDQLDQSYYDLLASEARLTSFIAIAKGDVPASHWFHLGRNLVRAGPDPALISWSGSMFEYLMPCLVMQSPHGSLLDDSCRRAVDRQIQYGLEKNLPWGISESAYNKRDLHFTYQYSSFGVPDLGLKRGLEADLVIAPYASILATLYRPSQAVKNLRQLQAQGALGLFGFFEAVDFTLSRLQEGRNKAIVKAYMAHHQGMSLVALANIFSDSSMQKRFHLDPSIQATSLLLQESIPLNIGTLSAPDSKNRVEVIRESAEHTTRRCVAVNRPVPATHILSNGQYTVMVTAAGAGFSRMHDLAVTRWREDTTRDNYGFFLYIKDCQRKKVWSAGYQPICSESARYQASFSEDRVKIVREDYQIESRLDIFVSPEENAEIRQLTLINRGSSTRELEVTSYFESVLNAHQSDLAHPAFSNLFVETEFNPKISALIASRRPRSFKDKRLWMMHALHTDFHSVGPLQYETDRSRFLGRGRNLRRPAALFESENLSDTVGSVLDPVMSLRRRIRLEPGDTCHLVFSLGVTETREAIDIMAEKFSDASVFNRINELAWQQAQIKLFHLGVEPDEAHLFQQLAARLIYSDPSLRPPSELLKKNIKNLGALWALGISGDLPIVIVRIDDIENRSLVRHLLKAQIYLSTKGFHSDLVILNEAASSYSQDLQLSLERMAQTAFIPSDILASKHGKVFVLRRDLISEADCILLTSEARAIFSTHGGSLSDQVKRTKTQSFRKLESVVSVPEESETGPAIPQLEFFNGLGGFSTESHEYSIVLKNTETTPAPWINVIANSEFGFQVSESGSGYTWSSNSRENQLTPWSNDPVGDPSGEAFFIRDRDSGAVWSPTISPIRLSHATYTAHHGQGYSRFETQAYGIFSELKQFVLVDQPVKVSRLRLENRSSKMRRLTLSSYVEWVLGFSRSTMAPTMITEFDDSSQAIFALNPRNPEHGGKVAFNAVLQKHTSFTCDRTEFIGRNSDLSQPAGILCDRPLLNVSGCGLDPCAALQTEVQIPSGKAVEVIFVLGQAENRVSARNLMKVLREDIDLHHEFERVKTQWNNLLETVQVETPDRSFDLLLNRWLLYQTIVCRIWARAAFYQAGGAFGFRDQLQDVMAVMLTAPSMAREQILRAASRQFIEGDVQHWWHPPLGRGVRTRFSDDLLWLSYVVSRYLDLTQDHSILDEMISFLEGPSLLPEQEDNYFLPDVSSQKASLYEHCARALDQSLKLGRHGLPLMGGGDWNDGMNHVGIKGQGESVWLAWFLIDNLKSFEKLAAKRGDGDRATKWKEHATHLAESTEKNAWDGFWYRRAYFDDGTPLGSAESSECQIDSLSQTWAVMSGAGQTDRARTAMNSVYEKLVKSNEELILLFTPPFDQTNLDPGYVKGYLPGVRENGGQYTHAASWVVIATALLGDRERAWKLFSFLNPIRRSIDLPSVNRYKIEPYVLPGDVYSEEPNAGRGGWSWYTGAAGWLYRAGIENILGFQVIGSEILLKPCVPPEWKKFKIRYKYKSSTYFFHVEIDGPQTIIEAQKIQLIDDGKEHEVYVRFSS